MPQIQPIERVSYHLGDWSAAPRTIRCEGAVIRFGGHHWRAATVDCFAERFVLTVRTEVTDRMLIFGGRHLRSVLAQYSRHYNRQRPHRPLQLRPPRPQAPVDDPIHGRIRRRTILGGLINH